MSVKKKIIGTVCALTILGASSFSIAYADEVSEAVKEFKGKIHKSFTMMDFSDNTFLTDEQKDKLSTLQTKLKEIMEEEKSVKEEIKAILKDSGVMLNEKREFTDGDFEEKNGEIKRPFGKKNGEMPELTNEELQKMHERKGTLKNFNEEKVNSKV